MSILQSIKLELKRIKEFAKKKHDAYVAWVEKYGGDRPEPEVVRAVDPNIRQRVFWKDGWYCAQVWHKDQERFMRSHPGLGEGYSATPQGALRNALRDAGLEAA